MSLLLKVSNSDCATLDPTLGERAMLIKDNYGDWGICVGVWKNFKMGANQGATIGLLYNVDFVFKLRCSCLVFVTWYPTQYYKPHI